jgi:DNA-binding NarL/FixJ family response regulator
MKVLLIEDDEFCAYKFRQLVRSRLDGAEVTLCKSEKQVLTIIDQIAEGRFDVIFIDQILPDGRGADIARRIRRAEAGIRNKLVMLTFCDADQTRAEALAYDIDGFMRKPVSWPKLSRFLLNNEYRWNIADLPSNLGLYRELRRS